MSTHADYPTGYGAVNDVAPQQAVPRHPVFYNRDVDNATFDRLSNAGVSGGRSFRRALARALSHADEHHVRDLGEAVGAFLVSVDRWESGVGWVCEFDYVPLRNVSLHPQDSFEVSQDELVEAMRSRVERRIELATRYVIEQNREVGGRWFGPGSWKAAAEDMEGGMNESDAADLEESGLNPAAVTAAQYMCITGPVTLAGLFHSHPSGSTDLSPQDFHGASVLDTWRQMFQYRLLGQSGDSRMETRMTVDNWIWAAPVTVGGDSVLVRYDRSGKKSEWSGRFVA